MPRPTRPDCSPPSSSLRSTEAMGIAFCSRYTVPATRMWAYTAWVVEVALTSR